MAATRRFLMNLSLAAAALLLVAPPDTAPRAPWREDRLFRQIAARLDGVRAIDNHTHLLEPGNFTPELDAVMPLGLRSTTPGVGRVLAARFGVSHDRGLAAATESAKAVRASMVQRMGAQAYWIDHLDYTRTEVALVNQDFRDGTDGKRLRWVSQATNLLY